MLCIKSATARSGSILSEDLDVLVSANDIVRYLWQHDDIVFHSGKGAYLVNGRFRETLQQLVERANRIRARRKLANFVLAPNSE